MENQKNKIKPVDLTRKFNGQLGDYLSRIENVLNYYDGNPDRLKQGPGNKGYLANFCDFYFKLRGILQKEYGFDYGDYDKKLESGESGESIERFYLPNNKTGISVDQELLKKDSEIYGRVGEIIKIMRGQN